VKTYAERLEDEGSLADMVAERDLDEAEADEAAEQAWAEGRDE
jgi:hypothetical protein